MIIGGVLLVVGGLMAAEAWLARAHEQALIERGAREPAGDVIALMRIAYPGSFLAMAGESALTGGPAPRWLAAGAVVFAAAKALKYWAIASLGRRWTFRVLVLDDQELVRTGPYRFLRHPNYVAVAFELASAGLMFGAPLAGALATIGFIELMRRRIRVEESALGIR